MALTTSGLQNETYALLGSLLSLQPKVSSGGGMSRDDVSGSPCGKYGLSSERAGPDHLGFLCKQVIDGLAADIEKRIPREIPLEPVKRKYPVDYYEAMNTVLSQEITRYNNVLVKINANVLVLRRAVKGLVVMSGPLEEIGSAVSATQSMQQTRTVLRTRRP